MPWTRHGPRATEMPAGKQRSNGRTASIMTPPSAATDYHTLLSVLVGTLMEGTAALRPAERLHVGVRHCIVYRVDDKMNRGRLRPSSSDNLLVPTRGCELHSEHIALRCPLRVPVQASRGLVQILSAVVEAHALSCQRQQQRPKAACAPLVRDLSLSPTLGDCFWSREVYKHLYQVNVLKGSPFRHCSICSTDPNSKRN